MALKRFSCRTHGGVFTKEARPGRQPVRCQPEFLCDKADTTDTPQQIAVNRFAGVDLRTNKQKVTALETASEIKNRKLAEYMTQPDFDSMSNTELKAYAREHFSTISKLTSRAQLIRAMETQLSKQAVAVAQDVPEEIITPVQPVQRQAKPRSTTNPSLPMAKAAKEQLVAVGWTVEGRAWNQEGDATLDFMAEVTASRGAETLVIVWQNGELVSQTYAMNYVKPSDNGLPGRQLKFDPDELTDRELIQKISGMKVTWWNTLASSTESAVIPGEKVTVQHIFFGNGDEDNSKRIVTFVDRNAGGFRSFHTSMLMKVG